jgi:putative transposase
MAQSLARILIHIVFSTKNREKLLSNDVRTGAFAYMATVGRDMNCEVFRVGGMADHVHLAISLNRTVSTAEFVKKVKQTTSVWMKEHGGCGDFEWQAGYGAFSIGEWQLPALVRYVENQESHHRVRTFQEEYRELLGKYGVESDERYLWD